jgi:hypothetical protein
MMHLADIAGISFIVLSGKSEKMKIEFNPDGSLKPLKRKSVDNEKPKIKKKLKNKNKNKVQEENAIVLDFLPNGYASDNTPNYKKNAIVQAIGERNLTLMEMIPKKGINFLSPKQRVYIGEGKRDEIHHIIGKLKKEKLTKEAKNNLQSYFRSFKIEDIIIKLISKNKSLKIVDHFYRRGTKIFISNIVIPESEKKLIADFIKLVKNKDIEIVSQIGMLRQESIYKGKNFHI